ncbi:hypothetical protein R6Q57_026447 [Mikania cordata]
MRIVVRYGDKFKKSQRGSWSVEEDHKLITYINKYGIWNWSQMPKFAGLSRSGKSCRLRCMNYLKPNLKKGKFSKEEEESLLHYHSLLGNSADHDILSSHDIATSSDHQPGVQFRADNNDNYTCSPGTIDDLQCFWDQLYPFENLEFGNNHNMDMFFKIQTMI